MIGKDFVLRHQRPGADETAAADSRPVEHDRAHSDQRAVADPAAVQDHVVADRAVLADLERKAHVGVQRAELLDVRPRADDDRLVVAPQHRAEPYADVAPEPDVADQAGVGGDPVMTLGRQLRAAAFERIERHRLKSPRLRSSLVEVDVENRHLKGEA